jgi:peptidoglycan-associated lipoprotein
MTTSTPPVSSGACTFDAIFFEFDDSSLSAEARAIVDRNAECLRKTAGGSVMVEGHADRRGTEEYNLALSERRARSVEERLRVLGLERGRLQVVGKGKLEASGANDSGYAKDRRVELKWR